MYEMKKGMCQLKHIPFCLFVHYLLDSAVLVVEQALYLERAQVRDVVAGNAVVIAQIPLALELDDAVVGSPAYDGVEDDALIGERSVGIIRRWHSTGSGCRRWSKRNSTYRCICASSWPRRNGVGRWPSGAGHPCRE